MRTPTENPPRPDDQVHYVRAAAGAGGAGVLPALDRDSAKRAGERILELLKDKSVPGPEGALPLQCSLGMTALEPHIFASTDLPYPMLGAYFTTMVKDLARRADEALYEAKRGGRNRLRRGATLSWAIPMPVSAPEASTA